MSTQTQKTRIAYWDNIKGILMLLVVFAHILYQLQAKATSIDIMTDCIYMFHMPAFVFVSGYFGKSKKSRSKESIIKLLFMYFIFNSITGFIYGFRSILQPMYSYWYLITLIFWRLTTPHIAKFQNISKIIVVISIIMGFYPSIDNTFAVTRIIGFYPYYLMGYLLTEEKSKELYGKPNKKSILLGSFALLGTAAATFISHYAFLYTDELLYLSAYRNMTDMFGRLALYGISWLAIYALTHLSPNKKIPLITMFGEYTLWIFMLHRPITLILSDILANTTMTMIYTVSGLATILICIILGNKFIAEYMNDFVSKGTEFFTSGSKKINSANIISICVAAGFIISAIIGPTISQTTQKSENTNEDILYPILSQEQEKQFNNAFRITFAGDLILLEDQVKRAYNGETYDFTDIFAAAKPYIESADLAIGVFEGPAAGEDAGYTTGNFDDGKDIRLNFPDTFIDAVRDTGFDLITTANNHLLDKGENGALRTLDTLDVKALDHTGSYRSEDEKQKEHIKLIEYSGIRFAVLSYTYGSNYIDTNELVDGKYSYMTSIISGTNGPIFEKLKHQVEQDFIDAKQLSPDLIIVLPHIGTQFSNEFDAEQETWFKIFKENGADIILGDHPHAVEPVCIETTGDKTTFTAYCPGNFANIYREEHGDTSMLIDVYIDKTKKTIIGGSIVPLYTYSPADGNYKAVPIYDIMTDIELRKELTTDDIDRAAEANALITKTVFGHEFDITSVTERYYFNEQGFLRSKASGTRLTDDMKNNLLYRSITAADTTCFIGDSVTEGTKNGGCPWYEPIETALPYKNICQYAKGGCTVSYMIEHINEIPTADLYVIALGTNDVRYRNEKVCAMTADEYIDRLDELKSQLTNKNNDAKFIFIAPWYSVDGDPFCSLSFQEKTNLNEEYTIALERYCISDNIGYINANPYIKDELNTVTDKTYLLDHIHPNQLNGVRMYSEAALSY